MVHPVQVDCYVLPEIALKASKGKYILPILYRGNYFLYLISVWFIDDMLIKLWNWEKQWACQQVFEGHTHYVMQIIINPKDNNTFASASLDRTVKVWQLGSSTPNFTLEGHEKGVNCVDYYHAGDKPYLISGADDRLVKIWDYQNKTCVQTLEGHAQNISAGNKTMLNILINYSNSKLCFCPFSLFPSRTSYCFNRLRRWYSQNLAFRYLSIRIIIKLWFRTCMDNLLLTGV